MPSDPTVAAIVSDVAGDGAELLTDIAEFIASYVSLPSEQHRDAVALWAVHTHAISAAESTPRLAAVSPEKGSGKTRLLEVLEQIVPVPRHAVNMTAAALFRAVAAEQPTLLFDEADTYFGPHSSHEHEELRGLVNAGHRRGAVAYRVVGTGSEMNVRAFPAFAAVALAGIGDLPDTILDRSVLVRMRRRAPDEQVGHFRLRHVRPVAEPLRCRMAEWVDAHIENLADADPTMPPGLVDRAADVWEPLIAIADEAGSDWPARARLAAMTLNAERQAADPSLGVRLLHDAKRVFDDSDAVTPKPVNRLSSEDLVRRLVDLDESPWGDLRGKSLDARSLAARLGKYEIRPRKLRSGETTFRGYETSDFYEAWRRYVPSAESAEQPEQLEHGRLDQALVPEHDLEAEQKALPLTCHVPPVPPVPPYSGAVRDSAPPVPDDDTAWNGSGTDDEPPDDLDALDTWSSEIEGQAGDDMPPLDGDELERMIAQYEGDGS